MSHQEDIRKLLTNYQRRLQRLKEQKAQFGINTSPEILNEIEDIEVEIEKLQTQLGQIESVEPALQKDINRSGDVPPLPHSQKSLFIYGGPVPPSHFVGRRDEIDNILDRLANPVRGSVAIFGDPIGKTSLLHYLRESQAHEAQQLGPNPSHFIYVDCYNIVPFSEADFWGQTLRELAPHLKDDEFLNGRIQQLLVQASPASSDLNSLFDSIARAGRLVVLMLDEFEWVMKNLDPNAPSLLYHLRALINRPERGLVLLISTRRSLKQLCDGFNFHGSPFDNPFLIMALPPFNEAEVDQLLGHSNFSATERDYVRQMAGAHPYLIQLTASLIVRARSRAVTSEISFAELELDLDDEADRYFTGLLSYSGDREKMLLAWLALAPLSQHLPASRAVLGELGRGFGHYDPELAQLIKRGLALREAEGLRLFSPLFNKWILHKVIIAGGREALSTWEPYYINFLSPVQEEALKDLVDKVIRWPAATRMPELLAQLVTQEDITLSVSPVRGKSLGRYIIEEQIGGGGMADVFKARDPRLDRSVAIKILRTSMAQAEEFQTRFQREAKAIAALRHPHIVRVYDFDIQSGYYYMIIMEFIQGYNLQEHLRNLQASGQSMTWKEVVRISTGVAEALDYAHQLNMIHRDVKSSNILLDEGGGVFLADFGLVRLLGQTGLTQTGGFVGTLAYMAPEQMMGDKEEIDYQVDIYALGCVVYEMITGRVPFEAAALPLAHFNTKPTSPDLIVPTLPEAAAQIMLKALAKNPAERPASATQFIEDLRQALNQ